MTPPEFLCRYVDPNPEPEVERWKLELDELWGDLWFLDRWLGVGIKVWMGWMGGDGLGGDEEEKEGAIVHITYPRKSRQEDQWGEQHNYGLLGGHRCWLLGVLSPSGVEWNGRVRVAATPITVRESSTELVFLSILLKHGYLDSKL